MVSVTPQPRFTLGKGPTVPIGQEAGWAPEPVWKKRIDEKSFRLCRRSNLDRPVVQPVARHYTDWATRFTKYTATSLSIKHTDISVSAALIYFIPLLCVSWVVTPSRLVGRYESFGETTGSIWSAEARHDKFLRNVCIYRRVYRASLALTTTFPFSSPWKPKFSHFYLIPVLYP
jgi:hypothetical protein